MRFVCVHSNKKAKNCVKSCLHHWSVCKCVCLKGYETMVLYECARLAFVCLCTHANSNSSSTIAYWYLSLLKIDNNRLPDEYLRVNSEKGQPVFALCTCAHALHMEQILNSHKELSYSFEYLSRIFIALFKWFSGDIRRKIFVAIAIECTCVFERDKNRTINQSHLLNRFVRFILSLLDICKSTPRVSATWMDIQSRWLIIKCWSDDLLS